MDVTGRSVSHSDNACLRDVEPDRQLSAEALARCRKLFGGGEANGVQEREKHLGCSLAILRSFQEHQLLEQVKGMHGLGAGPLKRGLPFSELAAIIDVLQVHLDKPSLHAARQQVESAAIVGKIPVAECGGQREKASSMEWGKITKQTRPIEKEARPLFGNTARMGHYESKDGDEMPSAPSQSTYCTVRRTEREEQTDTAAETRGRRHCLPEQPSAMPVTPNFVRGHQNQKKERPSNGSAHLKKPPQNTVSSLVQPSYLRHQAAKPLGTFYQSPGKPPLVPLTSPTRAPQPSIQASTTFPPTPAPAKATANQTLKEQTSNPEVSSEELEVATFRAASQLISALQFMVLVARQRQPLSLNLLLRAHGILMDGLCSHPGQLRKTGCKAGDGFRYPPPKEVLWRSRRWVVESNRMLARTDLTPWTKASHILLVFVHEIHPFQDGNGRMCRLLMNFVLAREGLPFTVLLTRGGANRGRYVRAIKESYRVGSCVPMTRRVLYAVDDARRAWERFKKLSGDARKGFPLGGDPVDSVPLGVVPSSGGLARGESKTAESEGWTGGPIGNNLCANVREGDDGGVSDAADEAGHVSIARTDGTRGQAIKDVPCAPASVDPRGKSDGDQSWWPSASSTAATVGDALAHSNIPENCHYSPHSAQTPQRSRFPVDKLHAQKSNASWLRRTDPDSRFASLRMNLCPTMQPEQHSGRPFIDGVPEACGRQVYGDRQGRKRARPPSEPPSSNGTGGANDTGSDDTGTSDSGGGSEAPSGGGQDGDSGDTGSDDSAADNTDTGTEDGSSSQEESAQDGSESDSAATPADEADTGSSDSDTQPVASDSSNTEAPVEDGSTEESDMVPVNTGSSEEEGLPGEATDTGSDSSGTYDTAESGSHVDTSDSEVHGVALSDSGSEDLDADEGSDSSETGDVGSFSDSGASEDSDDGSDEILVGWGAVNAPAPPAPAAPPPSVRIDLVAADDELPDTGGEADTCTICMERKKNGVVIPCGHVFCRRCAEQLRAERGKCAVCNKDIVGAYKLYGG